jgi:hypothetical protein
MYRTTFHWLSWIMPGERTTLSQDRLSSGSGATAPTGLLPPPLSPPSGGALTPVPLVQREYHLPLPLAGYQSLCVSSLLSASALCSNANLFITAHCSLLSAHCSCVHLLKAFACLFFKNMCCCSTSRSLLPDAYIDILHSLRWLLFHPRAVTPLGPSPRTRVSASVHYACSHLCTCAQGDQIHHTREASRKSVSYLSLATRGQSGSGIRSHHDHHSEVPACCYIAACNHSSERYSILSMATSFSSGLSVL